MTVQLDSISSASLFRLVEVVGVGARKRPIAGFLYIEGESRPQYVRSTTDMSGKFRLRFYVKSLPRPRPNANGVCVYGFVRGALKADIL